MPPNTKKCAECFSCVRLYAGTEGMLVADLHQSVKSLWQDSSCMFQLASA